MYTFHVKTKENEKVYLSVFMNQIEKLVNYMYINQNIRLTFYLKFYLKQKIFLILIPISKNINHKSIIYGIRQNITVLNHSLFIIEVGDYVTNTWTNPDNRTDKGDGSFESGSETSRNGFRVKILRKGFVGHIIRDRGTNRMGKLG